MIHTCHKVKKMSYRAIIININNNNNTNNNNNINNYITLL